MFLDPATPAGDGTPNLREVVTRPRQHILVGQADVDFGGFFSSAVGDDHAREGIAGPDQGRGARSEGASGIDVLEWPDPSRNVHPMSSRIGSTTVMSMTSSSFLSLRIMVVRRAQGQSRRQTNGTGP